MYVHSTRLGSAVNTPDALKHRGCTLSQPEHTHNRCRTNPASKKAGLGLLLLVSCNLARPATRADRQPGPTVLSSSCACTRHAADRGQQSSSTQPASQQSDSCRCWHCCRIVTCCHHCCNCSSCCCSKCAWPMSHLLPLLLRQLNAAKADARS
jgi:hypothetical protein